MNKKKKVLLCFLLLALFSKIHALNDTFLAYCKHINDAELNIMENNMQEALICYDSAFSLYSQPWAKDIHNAIVCAKKIKDEQKIKKYLDVMVATKSLKPVYYKEKGLLKYLSGEEKEKIKQKYTDKIKSEDYLFIQRIIQEDQAIRTQKNYSQRHYLIRETDSLTYEKYKAHFGDTFPGEELTLDLISHHGIDLILFHHWIVNKGLKFEAVNKAEKMVEDLKYNNYHYAYQYDAKLGNTVNYFGYGLTLKMVYTNKKTRKMLNNNKKENYIQFSPENIIEINERRAKIGLETYDEYVRKIEFFTKHREYCFPISYYRIFTR